jgi:hypothetical protein
VVDCVSVCDCVCASVVIVVLLPVVVWLYL